MLYFSRKEKPKQNGGIEGDWRNSCSKITYCPVFWAAGKLKQKHNLEILSVTNTIEIWSLMLFCFHFLGNLRSETGNSISEILSVESSGVKGIVSQTYCQLELRNKSSFFFFFCWYFHSTYLFQLSTVAKIDVLYNYKKSLYFFFF